MNCEQVRQEMLDALTTGATPPREVETHLAGCAACREALQRMRDVLEDLGPAGQLVEPPESVWEGILARTAERRRAVPALLAAAAALALVAGISFAIMRQSRTRQAQITPANAVAQATSRPSAGVIDATGAQGPSISAPQRTHGLGKWMTLTPRKDPQTGDGNTVWEKWPAKT